MTKTTNYQLNQWAKSDRVMMDDFNADNAKIDAALKANADAIAAETAARLGVPEEKSVLLQHLILSHHGEPEFGAAVRPLCAEAELLSLIDAVDSRMEIYRETYDTMEPDTFSPRIFALEKKVFRHA